MSKYIDVDRLKAEIDKRYTEYRAKMKTDDFTYYEGMADALDLFEQFLDTLPEQEHPIYELNQILLDWVREAKTDKEHEARFDAHKRFFELYDEYMMQEPEQPDSDEKFRNLLDAMGDCGFSQDNILLLKSIWEGAYDADKKGMPEQPVEGLDAEIERYFNGWDVDREYGDVIKPDYTGLSLEECKEIARHFAEWGRKQALQEIYDGKVKPVDKIIDAWLDDEQNT